MQAWSVFGLFEPQPGKQRDDEQREQWWERGRGKGEFLWTTIEFGSVQPRGMEMLSRSSAGI